MVSCIPQNEMVVFAGDMNGHVFASFPIKNSLYFLPIAPKSLDMKDMKGHMVVLGTALGTLMVPGYWSLQMG